MNHGAGVQCFADADTTDESKSILPSQLSLGRAVSVSERLIGCVAASGVRRVTMTVKLRHANKMRWVVSEKILSLKAGSRGLCWEDTESYRRFLAHPPP